MLDKCQKISKLIKKMMFFPLRKFHELTGKIQHVSFGINAGKDYFHQSTGPKKVCNGHRLLESGQDSFVAFKISYSCTIQRSDLKDYQSKEWTHGPNPPP